MSGGLGREKQKGARSVDRRVSQSRREWETAAQPGRRRQGLSRAADTPASSRLRRCSSSPYRTGAAARTLSTAGEVSRVPSAARRPATTPTPPRLCAAPQVIGGQQRPAVTSFSSARLASFDALHRPNERKQAGTARRACCCCCAFDAVTAEGSSSSLELASSASKPLPPLPLAVAYEPLHPPPAYSQPRHAHLALALGPTWPLARSGRRFDRACPRAARWLYESIGRRR